MILFILKSRTRSVVFFIIFDTAVLGVALEETPLFK